MYLKNRLLPSLITTLLLVAIAGCSTTPKRPPPSRILGYPNTTLTEKNQLSQIRTNAFQEIATTLGAQSGLAWAAQRINESLEKDDHNLNEVFNFRRLILNQNVLPPVLIEGRNELNIDNPETLRLADAIYRIESPPRFVTAAPTWRDYLRMNYSMPEKPNPSLLPHTDEERKVWNTYVAQGWEAGIQQANQIFSANLARLKRDYHGMITYRTLLDQHMVTAPFVGKTEMGVTGDEKEMRVNDQVLRITSTSKLVPNSKVWKPVIVPGTEGAVRKQGIEGTETQE